MPSQATGKSLTDCPSNLKEAIDWILRVTGKDGGGGGTKDLSTAVSNLLEDIRSTSSELQDQFEAMKRALTPGPSSLIDILASGLKEFRDGTHSKGQSASQQNVYNKLTTNNLSQTVPNAAKIFLGCLPMIFSALSYLYWRCNEKGNGAWKDMRLWDPNSYRLRNFMGSAGYDLNTDLATHKSGAEIAKALTGSNKFQELSSTSPSASFAEFLTSLKKQSDTKPHPLSSLHLLASTYFQHQRSTDPSQPRHPPSTIREMLYWLSGLAITPQFIDLLENFSSVIGANFHVAVSGSHEQNEKLPADDLAGHLITSCLSSLWILGTIQGSGNPDNPLLHDIYSNSEFVYPSSGTGLFNVLGIYTYALQFQLYFLYTQCSSTYNLGCGWNQCQYGAKINVSNDSVPSHICAGFKCQSNPSACNHGDRRSGGTTNECTHNDRSKGCGQGANLSPLQAFLTDNLKGFSLPNDAKQIKYPEGHMSDHPPGSMCHVKMGFSGKLRPNSRKGNLISIALQAYCGSPTSPLRQLCEKLGCLTKRTPRTLGDLFGFMWHLNGQLFKSRPTLGELAAKLVKPFESGTCRVPKFIIEKLNKLVARVSPSPPLSANSPTPLSLSLEAMALAIPFLYQLFMAEDPNTLPGALFDLTQHCHMYQSNAVTHNTGNPSIPKHQCSDPADLWSLYNPVYSDTQHAACRGKSCGGYLEPLTLTDGATFSPYSASAYLSWMAYLTDVFYEQLSEMRDDFNRISCDNCNSGCTNGESCHSFPGSACACTSVVQCSGVLPLLYRYGYQFYDTTSLNGWKFETGSWQRDNNIKRSCQKFSDQLSNVLSADAPLAKLLESIDSFLYLFRFYFFYNLSSFWLCSLLILLYFIFYGIDLLHLKSHVHLPSSHTVPPIGLLTTGKTPALRTLTYYMP